MSNRKTSIAMVASCIECQANEMSEARRAPRWHLVGAGVTLLAIAGAAAACSSSGALLSASAERRGAVQDWEELPGMEKLMKKAQSLTNLPTKHPWIRSECTIDTVQAVAYLGQAVVCLYKAIDYAAQLIELFRACCNYLRVVFFSMSRVAHVKQGGGLRLCLSCCPGWPRVS